MWISIIRRKFWYVLIKVCYDLLVLERSERPTTIPEGIYNSFVMKVNRKVIDIYDNEFNVLIEKLKDMNKLERRELYVSHSKNLFPRSKEVVNLEDQISGRHDYLHKFKRSFFIIGNLFFSTNNFGEYNQELFIRKIGYKSQR